MKLVSTRALLFFFICFVLLLELTKCKKKRKENKNVGDGKTGRTGDGVGEISSQIDGTILSDSF